MGGNNSGGSSYNPTQLGNQFGSRLTQYLSEPAPVFGQSGYVAPSNATQRGQGMIDAWGSSPDVSGALGNAFTRTNDLVSAGGLTDPMRADVQAVGDVGRAFGGMAGSAQDPSLTEERFGNASYGNNDPGYQRLRSNLANDVTTQSLSAFNNSGMFGSDDNKRSLSEGLGNALAGMDSEQYRYGQGLERQDVSNIDAMRQQGFSNRMGALGAQAGAAQTGFGMGQQGLVNQQGAMNSLAQRFQDTLLPGQTVAGVGALQDQDARARRAGEADLFDRTQNANYNRFQELLGAFSGSQQNAGMQEQVPWWQQALGFVAGNAGNALRAGM